MDEPIIVDPNTSYTAPKMFVFRPKEDITAFELAQALVLINRSTERKFKPEVEILAHGLQRHFEEAP